MSVTSLTSRPRLLGALAAALLVATALGTTDLVTSLVPANAETQSRAVIDPSNGFADLVEQVMPAVVSVQVKFANVASREGAQSHEAWPEIPGLPDDSPFRDFFRQFPPFRDGQPNMPQRRSPSRGQGSGFIITADGYAVTNNHVVDGAEEVKVTLSTGEELTAEVIGTDPKTDLALVKIKDGTRTFQFVRFAANEPRVGDWVVAVGNPFGLGGSVTTGVVSARGRDIGSGPYDDFLQIDASINRGNSGGPAFNLMGEVVGVNTAIFSPSGGSVGIGFAIPASTAQSVIDSLRTSGSVTRGWLGVQIQPVTEDIAASIGLDETKGAIISDVTENSPALSAGLKVGDTILKLDGKEVADARDLARKVAQIAPNSTVDVAIIRDGKPMTVQVKIGTMPNTEAKLGEAPSGGGGSGSPTANVAKLGLRLAPAPDGAGVQIVGVEPGSPAEERGLREGDIILEVAGQEVNGLADVRAAIEGAGKDKNRVLMLVRSGENQRFVAIPVDRG